MSLINDVSFSTTVFGSETEELDLISMLQVIKAAGYGIIEISRHHRNIAAREQLIRDSGLRVWAIHGSLGMGAASLDEDERKKAVELECQRMDDTSCFAPCPYVIHYLDRYNNPEHGLAFRKSIEELLDYNRNCGFVLTVETAPYKPEVNERYPDSREIAEFARSFGDELKMTIDINHSNLHESLADVCCNCKGLIANVHISNNHGVREEHLAPEQGIIDIKQVFRQLRQNGYCGPCNLEIHLDEQPSEKSLSRVYAYTRQLIG